MLPVYLTIFCRMAVIFTFAISFSSKLIDIPSFVGAIANFNLLPTRFHKVVGLLLLCSELLVVVLLVLGDRFLIFGYVLSIVLLTIFSIVIFLTLSRKIKTTCNCFGSNTRFISKYDIRRNIGLMMCAWIGYWLSVASDNS